MVVERPGAAQAATSFVSLAVFPARRFNRPRRSSGSRNVVRFLPSASRNLTDLLAAAWLIIMPVRLPLLPRFLPVFFPPRRRAAINNLP